MERFRVPAAIVVLLLVLSFFVGCSSGGDDSGGEAGSGDGGGSVLVESSEGLSDESGADDTPVLDAVAAEEAGSAGGGSTGSGGERPGQYLEVPTSGPDVIKTAQLNLEIEKESLRSSVQEAIDVTKRHGGFVLSSGIGDGKTGRGSLVLRVPAAQFESALAELKGIGEVDHEGITGQDVSQEFVDLQSRLRNYEAQEAVLLGLMEKAKTVMASIRVQHELQQVQLEIERLRGQLNYLEDQTSYSTITVDMVEVGAAPEPKPEGTLAKAWAQAKETFLGVVSATIVGAAFVLPVALLIALAGLVYRVFVRPRITPAQ